MENNYKIFATSNAKELGKDIANKLGVSLGDLHSQSFSDGEVFVRFDESIRGRTVFIVAQVNMPYRNLFELFMTVDAARRASAKEIICVAPYLPHSRQERKDAERTSISSRVVAEFLQLSGADRLMTIDLHTSSIEGFFNIPVDHLDTSLLFSKHIKDSKLENLCLCSPDFGGLKRIKKYKKLLDCEMAVIHKERLIPNQVSSMEIIGNVSGKDVVIIDDMIDTAGTLCKAAELIMEKGAKSVRAYCTHGLLSGAAVERIDNSALTCVYIADTINKDLPASEKIKSIECSKIIAKAIDNLLHNKSIKDLNEKFEI